MHTTQNVNVLRDASKNRLMNSWLRIFEKYGKDLSNESDEINAATGEIEVDRGHMRNSPLRPFGRMLDGASSDSDNGNDEDEDDEREYASDNSDDILGIKTNKSATTRAATKKITNQSSSENYLTKNNTAESSILAEIVKKKNLVSSVQPISIDNVEIDNLFGLFSDEKTNTNATATLTSEPITKANLLPKILQTPSKTVLVKESKPILAATPGPKKQLTAVVVVKKLSNKQQEIITESSKASVVPNNATPFAKTPTKKPSLTENQAAKQKLIENSSPKIAAPFALATASSRVIKKSNDMQHTPPPPSAKLSASPSLSTSTIQQIQHKQKQEQQNFTPIKSMSLGKSPAPKLANSKQPATIDMKKLTTVKKTILTKKTTVGNSSSSKNRADTVALVNTAISKHKAASALKKIVEEQYSTPQR
ncbi:hypothetical protein HK100_007219, partial [Physocladia obscura]